MSGWPPPLRIVVPMLLLLAGLVAGGLAIVLERRQTQNLLTTQTFDDLRTLSAVVAADLESELRRDPNTSVSSGISRLQADRRLVLALFVGPDGTIVEATRFGLAGTSIRESPLAEAYVAHAADVRDGRSTVAHLADSHHVVAIRPVWMPRASGELLASETGVLILEFDLSDLAVAEETDLRRRALTIALVVIGLCGATALWMRQSLLPRVDRLVRTTRNISDGRFDLGPPLRGRDELAEIGRAIDGMAVRIRELLAELRAEQAQVMTLNEDLERRVRERTAELEAFTYSVSHDLRAPLRAMQGFSAAVVEDCGPLLDDEHRRMLERVAHNARRMDALIDALLRLTRISRQPLRRVALDLGAVAEEVAVHVAAAHPDTSVELTVESGMRVEADGELLRVLLTNLLDNAFKFSAGQPGATVHVGREAGGGYFYVRDRGAGFDPAYAGKLFGVFERLHGADEFPGEGIGLALARRIVERHGGWIRAEGRPGEGATIRFTLDDSSRGAAPTGSSSDESDAPLDDALLESDAVRHGDDRLPA